MKRKTEQHTCRLLAPPCKIVFIVFKSATSSLICTCFNLKAGNCKEECDVLDNLRKFAPSVKITHVVDRDLVVHRRWWREIGGAKDKV